jgi:hypothetical protein
MDISAFMNSLQATLGAHVPSILGAIAILIVGWLLAVVARASVRKSLSMLKVNQRVSETTDEKMDVENGIAVIGFWLANLAYQAVARASGEKTSGLAQLARLAILGLVIAMGLRAMGIADDIVNLAFGLTLGAVSIAFALSFGLGGREAAGRQMEHWLSRLRKDD